MRRLYGASISTTLVITLGLLLSFIGIATVIWDPGEPRTMPEFFAGHSVKLVSIFVSYHQITMMTVAVLVGVQPLSGQIGQETNPAPSVTPRAQDGPVMQERTHTVRPGDTLWDLANHYYQNPYAWPTIADANPRVVEDPHWIYPEEVLVIPGAATMVAEGPPDAPGVITPVGQMQPSAPADPGRRTRFYRPNETGSMVFIDDDVRRAGVQPGEHYSAPWLANPDVMPIIGRVLRTVDSPPGDSEQDLLVHPFDDVYVEYAGNTRPVVGRGRLLPPICRPQACCTKPSHKAPKRGVFATPQLYKV
jgi:hypothetical protein